jgi:hypothetical protein
LIPVAYHIKPPMNKNEYIQALIVSSPASMQVIKITLTIFFLLFYD